MADEVGAMVQMVSVTMNGAEKCIKGSWVLLREVIRLLWQLSLKIKRNINLSGGEKSLLHFAKEGKNLRCVTMNDKQFETFKQNAKEYGIQYHSINDKKGVGTDNVTVFIPEGDAHKFNELVRNFNLNSVEDLGTVKAEDVDPSQSVDVSSFVEGSINSEGTLSVTDLHSNLVKSGLDADRADEIITDFLNSHDFETALSSGRIQRVMTPSLNYNPTHEIVTAAPLEAVAENKIKAEINSISSNFEAFGEDSIATRDWQVDRHLFVERRDEMLNTFKNNTPDSFDSYARGEIDKLDQIIELGDSGNLAAIEDNIEFEETFHNICKAESDALPFEVTDDVIGKVETGTVNGSSATQVGDALETKSIIKTEATPGMGTTNYQAILDNPSNLGDVVPDISPDIGPNITPPTPTV